MVLIAANGDVGRLRRRRSFAPPSGRRSLKKHAMLTQPRFLRWPRSQPHVEVPGVGSSHTTPRTIGIQAGGLILLG